MFSSFCLAENGGVDRIFVRSRTRKLQDTNWDYAPVWIRSTPVQRRSNGRSPPNNVNVNELQDSPKLGARSNRRQHKVSTEATCNEQVDAPHHDIQLPEEYAAEEKKIHNIRSTCQWQLDKDLE